MKAESLPELKQLIGALIFGANKSVSVAEIKKCVDDVANQEGGQAKIFSEASAADIRAAVEELRADIQKNNFGFIINEVAHGYRFHSDPKAGKWLRHLLEIGRPNRLSRPALETLAVIAYRQPVSRAEIEAIRGVNVDHMMKVLLELQLIKISGRSDLPGKPFVYGTTTIFLEHFGLKNIEDLRELEPSLVTGALVSAKKHPSNDQPMLDGIASGPDGIESEMKALTDPESENKEEVIESGDDISAKEQEAKKKPTKKRANAKTNEEDK